jgi:hypothetical protein
MSGEEPRRMIDGTSREGFNRPKDKKTFPVVFYMSHNATVYKVTVLKCWAYLKSCITLGRTSLLFFGQTALSINRNILLWNVVTSEQLSHFDIIASEPDTSTSHATAEFHNSLQLAVVI